MNVENDGELETSQAVFALLEKQALSAELRAVDRDNLLDAIKRRDMELVVVLLKEFRLPLPLGRSVSRAIN